MLIQLAFSGNRRQSNANTRKQVECSPLTFLLSSTEPEGVFKESRRSVFLREIGGYGRVFDRDRGGRNCGAYLAQSC